MYYLISTHIYLFPVIIYYYVSILKACVVVPYSHNLDTIGSCRLKCPKYYTDLRGIDVAIITGTNKSTQS